MGKKDGIIIRRRRRASLHPHLRQEVPKPRDLPPIPSQKIRLLSLGLPAPTGHVLLLLLPLLLLSFSPSPTSSSFSSSASLITGLEEDAALGLGVASTSSSPPSSTTASLSSSFRPLSLLTTSATLGFLQLPSD